MKKQFSFCSILVLTSCLIACNNASNKDAVEKADSANEQKFDTAHPEQGTASAMDEATSEFMVKVADVGMAEVEMGKLAQEKGRNQRVKHFGEMMVQDHSKANDELKSLAGKKNVTLPADVSEDHKKHKDDLSKKSGKDFDKSYMDMMVDGHQKTIDAFEKTSSNTKDADVKAWVDKILPTLRVHLDSAKAIKSALK